MCQLPSADVTVCMDISSFAEIDHSEELIKNCQSTWAVTLIKCRTFNNDKENIKSCWWCVLNRHTLMPHLFESLKQNSLNNCCLWHSHQIVTSFGRSMRSPAQFTKLNPTSAREHPTTFATNILNVQDTFSNVLEPVAKTCSSKLTRMTFQSQLKKIVQTGMWSLQGTHKLPEHVLIIPAHDDRTYWIRNV